MLHLASRQVFYHGTSSVFLRQILKAGVIPDPREHLWEESMFSPGVLGGSLPGSYWARNFKVAHQYARDSMEQYDGHPVIVAATIETRAPDVAVDEDISFGGRAFTWECLNADNDEELLSFLPDVNWYEVGECWLQRHVSDWKLTGRQWEQAARAMAPALEWQAYSYLIDLELLEAPDSPLDPLTPEEAHRHFRSAWDAATRKLRALVDAPSWVHDHAIRVTEPITYRGANRIQAIVEYWREAPVWHYQVTYSNDAAITAKLVSQIKAATKAREVSYAI